MPVSRWEDIKAAAERARAERAVPQPVAPQVTPESVPAEFAYAGPHLTSKLGSRWDSEHPLITGPSQALPGDTVGVYCRKRNVVLSVTITDHLRVLQDGTSVYRCYYTFTWPVWAAKEGSHGV